MRRSTALATVAVLASAVAGATVALAPVSSSAAEEPASPLVLLAPGQVTLESFGNRTYLDLALSLEAVGENFELWSKRPSYESPITTTWRRAGGDVELPEGSMDTFAGLGRFLNVSVADKADDVVYKQSLRVCLNGESARVTPDGAGRSPYPWDCPWNPFTLGSVQGIAKGWASRLYSATTMAKIPKGRYTATVTIAEKYRALFGIADTDAVRTINLRVVKGNGGGGGSGGGLAPPPPPQRAAAAPTAPDSGGPTGRRVDDPTGPVPNLASLPAYQIGISRGGNFLQFAATVWNSGTSPLVVDGFRREDEDVMDAYQYFYDENGEQVGYDAVGEMEWDARKGHQHWHFRDFARYTLLDTTQTEVRLSKKEAFCLANTDAIDYTVPFANWRPFGTDLQTACGDYSSGAVREVLDVGSGDTYAQFRPGQSFNLKGLENGIYYVAVEANPDGRLVETTAADNVSLRKIKIGGKEGARKVKVFPVGSITD